MLSTRAKKRIKLALLGDSGVGETFWLNKLLDSDALPSRKKHRDPSKPYDTASYKDSFGSKEFEYEFSIFNTSPNPRYHRVNELGLNGLDAYLIFYNVNNRQSFENVERHLKRIPKGLQHKPILLLVGTHFRGQADVTQEEAELKAIRLGMQSYYAVNAKLDKVAVIQPLVYITHHSEALKINVKLPEFELCFKEIKRALRFCWDKDRERELLEFKQMLADFSCFGDDVTNAVLGEMAQECHSIVTKAQNILEGAFPERVKMAVFGVAAIVLLTTAVVCGLALLNVIAIPILTGLLIAGCVTAGAGGSVSAGCCLFKAKENTIYSSIVDETERAVKDFPGFKK